MTKRRKPADGLSTVYMVTNLANGKRYIGITVLYLSLRKASHFAAAQGGSLVAFHRAIRKYGRSSFVFDVLCRLGNYEDAKKEEIRLIAEMKPEYNMTKGGDGYLGYVMSDERKKRHSEMMKGRPGYWKGKNIPEHVRENVKFAQAAAHKSPKRLARFMERIAAKQRRVVCLNDGIEYDSYIAATRAYNLGANAVGDICKGKIKSTRGLVFRYAELPHGGLEEALRIVAAAKKNQVAKLRTSRKNKRSVICEETQAVYDSVKECAVEHGLKTASVIANCRGNGPLRGYKCGRKFRYLDEWCINPL